MEIIIYGKDQCAACDKAKLLCQMQAVAFQYRRVGSDISSEELQAKVEQPIRSLPQIFIRQRGVDAHVGGYDALRQALRSVA